MIYVSVQSEDFDCGTEQSKMAGDGAGAIASFTGIVRGEGELVALELEHYPGMTQRALEKIAQDAAERWDLLALTIIHRTGKLAIGDQIVFVAASSAHRHTAFESCTFIMDRLKTGAPFWKKNHYRDGSSDWVDARSSDDHAAEKWEQG